MSNIELRKLSAEIKAQAAKNDADEDGIPSLGELVPRVRSKFTFLFGNSFPLNQPRPA